MFIYIAYIINQMFIHFIIVLSITTQENYRVVDIVTNRVTSKTIKINI